MLNKKADVKYELRELSMADATNDALYQMFQDMPASENGVNNKAHGLSKAEFAEWVKKEISMSDGKNLPAGWVPSTMYILWADGVPVGRGNLRHYLVPSLERDGGHIGLALSPKYRGRGYGHILLKEMLNVARAHGITRALVFNHDDNTAAWKLSERAGGKLESITEKPDAPDIKLRKYSIDLTR